MLGVFERLFNAQSDSERLERLRKSHFRWKRIPYDSLVQILRQHIGQQLPVGTVGRVLTKEEHGIKQHDGYAEITPDFPGIRGVDVLVRFGQRNPKIVSLRDLAPA